LHFKPQLLALRLFIPFIVCCILFVQNGVAQFTVSGTVYDSSKVNLVEGVLVQNLSGAKTFTDSLGKYSLQVAENDSLFFTYRNKSTPKYAVSTIPDINHFDIKIHLKVKGKYTTLSEVIVQSKSYRQDSIENRERYAKAFNFRPGHVGSSVSPTGGVGLDINDLINLFRFRRNKQLKAFRNRLEREEKERYVNYKFNKTLVSRITNLKKPDLDTFMIRYRPDYEFIQLCDELTLNQYIINAWYHYKMEMLKPRLPNLQKN
jgi:hypothetical protein